MKSGEDCVDSVQGGEFISAFTICSRRYFYFQKPPSVMVAHPSRGQAIEAVYATGTVESSITIRIATERAARLIALTADENMKIKAGQPLARFDDAELQASLQEMRIRQLNAEQHVSRIEKLYQRGATSVELLEQARADADAAKLSPNVSKCRSTQ